MKVAHKLCMQLENALLLPVKKEIPTSVAVKDPSKRQQLNAKLIDDIKQGNCMIEISQLQLSGVAFLFVDQYEFMCRVGKSHFQVDEKLSLDDLRSIVVKFFNGDYQALLNADVEAQDDGARVYVKPFVNFIDYVDTQDNYYLDEGKWYQFDKNYLGNVRNEVDKISLDFSTEITRFNEAAYQAWLVSQPVGKKHYRERYLNDDLQSRFGYVNHDRSISQFEGANIELTDLFKGDTVYFVKVGEPQTLNYAIDQALASVRVLERSQFQLVVNGLSTKVGKVCLWLFLERKTPIQKISDINSLIFLMKLAHWRKNVLLSSLQPEIRVSYK